MRGKRAKAIRRLVYGDRPTNRAGRIYHVAGSGQIFTDRLRMVYQKIKKGGF